MAVAERVGADRHERPSEDDRRATSGDRVASAGAARDLVGPLVEGLVGVGDVAQRPRGGLLVCATDVLPEYERMLRLPLLVPSQGANPGLVGRPRSTTHEHLATGEVVDRDSALDHGPPTPRSR